MHSIVIRGEGTKNRKNFKKSVIKSSCNDLIENTDANAPRFSLFPTLGRMESSHIKNIGNAELCELGSVDE